MPSFLCFAHIIHGGLLCSRSALTVNKALIIADPMYPGVYYMVNLFLKEYVNIKIILDYDGQKCHLILWTFYSAPSIFAVCRNLVREIWFEKSGLRKVVDQKKGGFIL